VAPAVSIIIATYNRAPVLRLALETVRRQTFTDWEALVIGDGCTDGSREIVAGMGDPRFHWHNLPHNSGSQAVPNNRGLELARAAWIAYLGHDDLWFPWHLHGLVDAIEEQGADFAHALVALFGEAGLYACWGGLVPGSSYAEHSIAPSTWLYRHGLTPEVGGWADPATLDMPVDFHLSRRIALAGARFTYQPRLSVLKFPSTTFTKPYRNEDPLPQASYLREMMLDSTALERRVLQEIANYLARVAHGWALPITRAFLAGGGSPDSVERYQAERRLARERRGLDDSARAHRGRVAEIHAIAPDAMTSGMPHCVTADGEVVLSVLCAGATPETFVMVDGMPLASRVISPTLVRAALPSAVTAQPGTKTVMLLNRAGASPPTDLVVRACVADEDQLASTAARCEDNN
jgi:glycosyltransferase involved in cell wall biosynthesis